MLAASSVTGIGWIELVILIGKVAGACLSMLGFVYAIGRLKPLKILWRRNVTVPLLQHRTRVVGEIFDAKIKPTNEAIVKYGEIIERELSPDHGEALVDKVDWLVQLHREEQAESKSHAHGWSP